MGKAGGKGYNTPMKTILISGPTGEVGLALINELLTNGYSVTAIVRPGSRRISRLPESEHLRVLECSLQDIPTLSDTLRGQSFDAFYHLGWDHSREHDHVDAHYRNIGHTLDAVRLAADLSIPTFIGAGSQAEYGRVDGVLSPDTPVHPETAYGMAKLCAGQMSRLLCAQLGIRHLWPRILSVYGPGDADNTMIISAIRTLLRGEKPVLTKGEQKWDFLYSSDCARALRLIMERGKDGAVYCIGSGTARPLREYMEALRNAIDPSLPLGIGELPYRDRQVMYLQADISSLEKDTGFIPEISFDEGIRRTIDWCRKNPAQ